MFARKAFGVLTVSVLWLGGCECGKKKEEASETPAPAAAPTSKKKDAAGSTAKKAGVVSMLPPDTLALARVADPGKILQRLSGSRTVKTAKSVLAAVSLAEGSAEEVALVRKGASELAGSALRNLKGECVLACLGIEAQAGFWPVPHLAFLTPADKGADAFLEDLRRVLAKWKQDSGWIRQTSGVHKGTRYERFGDSKVQICFGKIGEHLAVASSEKAYQALLAGKGGLAAVPAYAATGARVGDCDAQGYLNVTALRNACGQYQPAVREHKALQGLGISGLASVSYGLDWTAAGAKERAFLYCPAGREGIFRWFEGDGNALEAADLKYVPADALSASSMVFSPAGAWKQILAFAREMDPQGWRAGGQAKMKEFERTLGMPVEIFLGNFTGWIVSYNQEMRFGLASPAEQDFVHLIGLHSEEICRKGLKNLLGWFQGRGLAQVRESALGASTLYSFETVRADGTFTLSLGLGAGHLVVSRDPEEAKLALARIDAGGALPGILDDPLYRQSVGAMRSQGNCMGYCNLSRLYEQTLPMAQFLLAFAGPRGMELSRGLPSFAGRDAPPLAWMNVTRHEENGLVIESVSPAPALGLSGAALTAACPWLVARTTVRTFEMFGPE